MGLPRSRLAIGLLMRVKMKDFEECRGLVSFFLTPVSEIGRIAPERAA